MVEPIAEFFKTPLPPSGRAVLLGKGVSLDAYEPGRHGLGHYIMAINEAAECLPCDGGIYLDRRFADYDLSGGTQLFRSVQTVGQDHLPGYRFHRGDTGKQHPQECDIPDFGCATGAAALTILGQWGIRHVLMVGFDAWEGPIAEDAQLYADITTTHPRRARTLLRNYTKQNGYIQATLDHYGITPYWFHRCAW